MTEQIESQSLFLARFNNELILLLDTGEPKNVAVTGEMLVAGETGESGELVIEDIQRVSWATAQVEELKGQVTLAGPVYGDDIKSGSEGSAQLKMHLYYGLLRVLDPPCTESDATFAPMERIAGHVFWEPAESNLDNPQVQISFELDELIDYPIGKVQNVTFEKTTLEFKRLQRHKPENNNANSLVECINSPPEIGTDEGAYRSIALRFIILSTITIAASVKSDVQTAIHSACEVWWAKGGICIKPNSTILSPMLPTVSGYLETDPDTGITSFAVSESKEIDLPTEIPGPPLDNLHIEVYLVDKLSKGRKGGIAHACGSADAYIILEIPQLVHNHYLLAHELGHVFGLRHPTGTVGGGPCNNSDLPIGATCTVMVPDRPNSPRLTFDDLDGINAYNPNLGNAYETLETTGPRDFDDPEGFFQLVRDFPYDYGADPSELHTPFTNWTSRSDIWNAEVRPYILGENDFYALVDPLISGGDPNHSGDDMFSPAHYPNHRQPTYTGPNFMYTRVHTCQPLPVLAGAQVQVHLFLAYPGVSLDSLIKLVPAPDSTPNNAPNPQPFVDTYQPGMGRATVRFTKWEVPVSVPPHCCAFAAVTSISDPADAAAPPIGGLQDVIANPGNHNFYALWDRLKSDNDVAQRNYNVQGVPPSGAGTALPPMPFANIFKEESVAELEIDATVASLNLITLLVDGQEVAQIEGGQKEKIVLNNGTELQPRQQLELRLQAEWSSNQPINTMFPILLGFYLNNELVCDYEHLIQVVTPKEAGVQAMDFLYGSLRDVAATWDLDSASELAIEVRDIVLAARYQEDWATNFQQLGSRFHEFSQIMNENPSPDIKYDLVAEKLTELANLFVAIDTNFFEQVHDLAYQIQYAASHVIRST